MNGAGQVRTTISRSPGHGLIGMVVLVLAACQARAAPEVADALMEVDDYESVFAALISNSDIGDAANGATTAISGGFAFGGDNHAAQIDGTLAPPGTVHVGEALFPEIDGVLEIFLDTTVNTNGYDITSLVNFTGWNSASRADHQYRVDLRPVGGSWGCMPLGSRLRFTGPGAGSSSTELRE